MGFPEGESLPGIKREMTEQALKDRIIMLWEKKYVRVFLFGRNDFVFSWRKMKAILNIDGNE